MTKANEHDERDVIKRIEELEERLSRLEAQLRVHKHNDQHGIVGPGTMRRPSRIKSSTRHEWMPQ